MNYVTIGSFNYQERPNPFTICSGFDPTGRFIHQIIEDVEVSPASPLKEAVSLENENTVAFGKENDVDITYDEPVELTIDGVSYLIAVQEMSFDDGRHAVQANAYFFDPTSRVFRIVQFGTLPVEKEEWNENGERYNKYVRSSIRRLLSGMNATANGIRLPIRPFSETK